MNPDLDALQPYPFEQLRRLFAGVQPAADKSPIALSIGEPQHPSPPAVQQALRDNIELLSRYPSTRGSDALRSSMAGWLQRRFQLNPVDPESQVLPVTGTREALFAIAQAAVARRADALVLMPNPFYQIYEGAALLAGARPGFINCLPETGFLPDLDSVTAEQWRDCQLLYLCNPGNPSGAVMPLQRLVDIVQLAREHDFIVASDECYSEIYPDEQAPPPGLLQACEALGSGDYRNCLVFHSLSKRSNLPGLRSGFVAGDERILAEFLRYRTYHGCAMPPHHQAASIVAWDDEAHVIENRERYRRKFAAVLAELNGCLRVSAPDAGFYLWPETPLPDTEFARILFEQQHVTVLPGRFLARESGGRNPGHNRVRLALVAEQHDCVAAAQRIADTVRRL